MTLVIISNDNTHLAQVITVYSTIGANDLLPK